MKRRKRPGQWIDDIVGSIGRFIHFETFEGLHREGMLTGLRTREIEINGKIRDIPTAVELNGDPNDFVDFHIIRRITID